MLEKEDIRIRCVEETDLDFVFSCTSPAVRGDYQEFRFTSWQSVVSEYERCGMWGEDGGFLIIEDHNEPVGLINMVMVREGLARVGMILLPEARNKGTGTAALSLFVDNIMDNYPVARIEADTDCSNLAAQHMLENAGFLCEGTLRAFRFHHGFYHDSLLYSFIRE